MDPVRTGRLLIMIASGLWACQATLVCVCLVRRSAGAFLQPLTGLALCGWSVVVLAFSVVSLVLFRAGTRPPWGLLDPSRAGLADEGWWSLRRIWPESLSALLTVAAILGVAPGNGMIPGLVIGLALVIGGLRAGLLLLEGDLQALLSPDLTSHGSGASLPHPVLAEDPSDLRSSAWTERHAILPWPARAASVTDRKVHDPGANQAASFDTVSFDNAAVIAEEADEEQDAELDEEDPGEDGDALQSLSRRRTTDADILEGTVLAEFAQNQREIQVHLSICPPFAGVPEVWLENIDGQDWDLKSAATYPFGLRLSVRRRVNGAVRGQIAFRAWHATQTADAAG